MEAEDTFDVVVSGTSLVNTIVAAALSLAGLTVLHVDGNEFYGEEEATLDLDHFRDYLKQHCGNTFYASYCHFHGEQAIDDARPNWRKYQMDLTPKLMACDGPLVQLLIQADVAKYLEFKTLEAEYLKHEEDARLRVPCSKSDVFQSTAISLIEKRYLMKFLTLFQDPQAVSESDRKEWEQLPFLDLLRRHNMEGSLQRVIVHSICGLDSMADAAALTASRGAFLIQRYVRSVARFARTAHLYPLYGLSEICQAFSRIAAVRGATFMLRRSLTDNVELAEGGASVTGVSDTEGGKWKIRRAVVTSPNATAALVGPSLQRTSKALHLAVASVPKEKKPVESAVEDVVVSPTDTSIDLTVHTGESGVARVLRLDSTLHVCPPDTMLCYVWSPVSTDVVSKHIPKDHTWSIEWTVRPRVCPAPVAQNVYVTSDPDLSIQDFDDVVEEARRIFHAIAGPDAVFFPPQPKEEEF